MVDTPAVEPTRGLAFRLADSLFEIAFRKPGNLKRDYEPLRPLRAGAIGPLVIGIF
jgi:hypothetical protein